MNYALLIYGDEKVGEGLDSDERRETYARYEAFSAMLVERGVMRGGSELAPSSSATTIRHDGDQVSVTDGPFAETAEVFGGFYLVEADDLDAAIDLAKQLPSAVVEIRPTMTM
ncbi:MAG: hypothetical protein QOH97_3910 [Actinoplanes sp.]|jgi:hypothetical protein|nr:hypothetical protein [Actinoplanes sp.]